MKQVHMVVGILAITLNGVAGLYGGWRWWRVQSSVWFWRILRAGQAVVIVEVVLGGVLLILGRKSPGLHTLYGVLPLLVSVIAEQLRVGTAQMVLDARGFESAQAVAKLPEEEQHVVALSIVQRELGLMALAAAVNTVLLWRAAATA
jgi:hypothetical protein